MAVPVIAPSPLSEISVLTPSWERALRAQNKSPRTIVGYLEGVALLETYLRAKGMPTNVTHLRREHVEAFVVDQVDLRVWDATRPLARYLTARRLQSGAEVLPHVLR